MNIAGNQFFACTTFTKYQNCCVSTGDPVNYLKNLLHLPAIADYIPSAADFPHLLLEISILIYQSDLLQSLTNNGLYAFRIERLGDIVISAKFHCLHSTFHRPISCNHNNDYIRINLFRFAQKFHSVHARHLQVSNDYVKIGLFQLLCANGTSFSYLNMVSLF